MKTILFGFNEIFCPNDPGRPLRGKEMNDAKILKDAYIAIEGEEILEVGVGEEYKKIADEKTELIECKGLCASPGLIDCHTHLVYGGDRSGEFSKKLNGMSYLDILAEGGGILSTQRATRAATKEELKEKTKKLLSFMLRHGVTTVEAKSGYGLDFENERKQMLVVKELNDESDIDLVSTFMAAHAIPKEYKNNPDAFIDEVIKMLPKVKEEGLAEFCDVFCEKGVFSAEQSKKLLLAAKDLGFLLRIHADEIASIGGVRVACETGAVSAEHLMMTTDEDIEKMAASGVIGNLLPATTFSLIEDTYAPARKMLEKGMAITISTDSNPGSCPTANLPFAMQLASLYMKLTPVEVYNAATINAAYSVNRAEKIGSFDSGKFADITIYDAPSLAYTIYFFATNLVCGVYKRGKKII